MGGKIYVYHHNDHDGIVAAGILYNHLRKDDVLLDEDFEFNMIDYNMELNFDHINPGTDQVYFLDYSFSNKHNIEEFRRLLRRREGPTDVIWIDHHKTSIGLLDGYHIYGIRNTALCGAAWTYLWLNGIVSKWTNRGIDLEYEASLLFHHSDTKVPKFLKYIDDYDCWKKKYDLTNDFHYGFNVSDPTDPIIKELLDDRIKAYDIVDIGKSVQKYLEFNDREYHVNMYGFEYILPEEHGGLKCFCLNRKGNSLMFGDKINEYDGVIPFYYNNGKWTYSLFSTKEDIDCSVIAKSYGGGGHKGAAGWVTDELIFKK